MTHVQRQENVMKSLSNLMSVQLMFSGLTCCGIQGIWAALLVISVSLLLPGCTDFSKLKHLNGFCLFHVISSLTVFSLKTTQVSVAPISYRKEPRQSN